MKLLIAEDDVLFQKMLSQMLAPEYEIVLACSGDEAWKILQTPDAPRLAILDWVMPGLTGPQICRKVRASERLKSMYLIVVTSKNNEADIVSGLRAGADDYIAKPPIAAELRARLRVGERILLLQEAVEAQSLLGTPLRAEESLVREPLVGVPIPKRPGGTETSREVSSYTMTLHGSGTCYPVSCAEGKFHRDVLVSSLTTLHSKG